MSTSIESMGIHPIVVLTISDFYNRMRVTSKGQVNRVYGALMGQKIGTKVEIFLPLNLSIIPRMQKR